MIDKESLIEYRLRQSKETMDDAVMILESGGSSRSVVNRLYYAIFYAVLAFYMKKNINLKTSKHSMIISMFDREFVHTGMIDKRYSKIFHKLFNERQSGDYKEFFELSIDKAREYLIDAKKFLEEIQAKMN